LLHYIRSMPVSRIKNQKEVLDWVLFDFNEIDKAADKFGVYNHFEMDVVIRGGESDGRYLTDKFHFTLYLNSASPETVIEIIGRPNDLNPNESHEIYLDFNNNDLLFVTSPAGVSKTSKGYKILTTHDRTMVTFRLNEAAFDNYSSPEIYENKKYVFEKIKISLGTQTRTLNLGLSGNIENK